MFSITSGSDEIDHRIDMAAITVIRAMNEHGLRLLKDRIAKLEALCDQLIEKTHQLRERVNVLERAVGQAVDDMDPVADEMENEEDPMRASPMRRPPRSRKQGLKIIGGPGCGGGPGGVGIPTIVKGGGRGGME
ncbi:hypothetical protein FPQ18DRAFT_303594 [Pyronema domesticum]|nr:hypothetical protein FPQ18DRAFT_303594 [Pyronema domesticum]